MVIDHDKLESLARKLCESSLDGNGDYDAKGTKRSHWRERALAVMHKADKTPLFRNIFLDLGWPV